MRNGSTKQSCNPSALKGIHLWKFHLFNQIFKATSLKCDFNNQLILDATCQNTLHANATSCFSFLEASLSICNHIKPFDLNLLGTF